MPNTPTLSPPTSSLALRLLLMAAHEVDHLPALSESEVRILSATVKKLGAVVERNG